MTPTETERNRGWPRSRRYALYLGVGALAWMVRILFGNLRLSAISALFITWMLAAALALWVRPRIGRVAFCGSALLLVVVQLVGGALGKPISLLGIAAPALMLPAWFWLADEAAER